MGWGGVVRGQLLMRSRLNILISIVLEFGGEAILSVPPTPPARPLLTDSDAHVIRYSCIICMNYGIKYNIFNNVIKMRRITGHTLKRV